MGSLTLDILFRRRGYASPAGILGWVGSLYAQKLVVFPGPWRTSVRLFSIGGAFHPERVALVSGAVEVLVALGQDMSWFLMEISVFKA